MEVNPDDHLTLSLTDELLSVAIPNYLYVFEKHYLTICTSIEYPGILARWLLDDGFISQEDYLQVRAHTYTN